MLGSNCRFAPSCSDYALEAITRHGASKGSLARAARASRAATRIIPAVTTRYPEPPPLILSGAAPSRAAPATLGCHGHATTDSLRHLLVLGALPLGGLAARATARRRPPASAQRPAANDAGRPPGAAGGNPARGRSGGRRRARALPGAAPAAAARRGVEQGHDHHGPLPRGRHRHPAAASITRGRAASSTATQADTAKPYLAMLRSRRSAR